MLQHQFKWRNAEVFITIARLVISLRIEKRITDLFFNKFSKNIHLIRKTSNNSLKFILKYREN